jgi:hypothetical protein
MMQGLIRLSRLLLTCAIGLVGLGMAAGCGDNQPKKEAPPPEQKMLDKLDSDDPNKFLEGVDEARDKYGKKE